MLHSQNKEYVSLLIELYTNNGSVSHVAIVFLSMTSGVSKGCIFTLIPNCMGPHHGQILIGTETDSS